MLEISKVNIKDLLTAIIKDFQANAQKKNITIHLVEKSEIADLIYNDAEKLNIIISNLLANAIEFSHTNSEINIVITQNSVEIIDNGKGFNVEETLLSKMLSDCIIL